MALPLLLLLPLVVLVTAIAYFALQQTAEAWLKPFLQWLFAPRQSFWKRVLLWPVREIGKGLAAVLRYTKRILGGAFFLAAAALAHWFHGYAWVLDRLLVGAEAFAKEVYKALVYLRNVAIPTLVNAVVVPVKEIAVRADLLAKALSAQLNAVSAALAVGLIFLPGAVPFGLAARFAYFANGVETLWDKVWKDLAPKLSQAITVTIPKLAGRITNLENDLYKTGAESLPQIRTRLKVLEGKFAGLLKGLTFRDAVLGLLAALAGVTVAVLTATLPSLFCRNTRGVAKRLCAFDETMLANLLLGTLLFALVLDPRALARVAEGVTETLDGVIRETVLR